MMLNFARRWWLVALRAALTLLFGATVLFLAPSLERPPVDLFAGISLVMLFSVFVAVNGALVLVMALTMRNPTHIWESVAHSMVLGALGVLAWVSPVVRLDVVMYLTVAQAAVAGLMELILAWQLRDHRFEAVALSIVGALSVAFACALATQASDGSSRSATLLGGYSLFYGLCQSVLAVRLRTSNDELLFDSQAGAG
jgi:uncharacterized membrane protein HdeD (DUF308 family)